MKTLTAQALGGSNSFFTKTLKVKHRVNLEIGLYFTTNDMTNSDFPSHSVPLAARENCLTQASENLFAANGEAETPPLPHLFPYPLTWKISGKTSALFL